MQVPWARQRSRNVRPLPGSRSPHARTPAEVLRYSADVPSARHSCVSRHALNLLAATFCYVTTAIASGAELANEARASEPVPEAESALRAAVERQERLGTDNASLATSLRDLALFYQTEGRTAEARSLHERALALRKDALGRAHPDIAQSLDDLAMLYLSEGDAAAAQRAYRQALSIQESLYGRGDPRTAININNLARVYAAQGKNRRAASLYAEELSILEQTYGAESDRIVSALERLAGVYAALEKPERAESFYRRAIDIAEQSAAPASDRRLIALLEAYANLLERDPGRATDVAELTARAAALRAQPLGIDRRGPD